MLKNFKKVISITLLAAFMLGTNAFAAYTDVSEESDIYSAVQELSSFDILKGYEDNTFRPTDNITRAEMCAVVCRARGLESDADKWANAKGNFTDVTPEHWANGYINAASWGKFVNGMGDDTFEPESNITYEQAVKMIVAAIGYGTMAEASGGWPEGYLEIADRYGISKGIGIAQTDSFATRAIVAKLIYNALPVPIMVLAEWIDTGDGFLRIPQFAAADGSGEIPYRSLITELGAAKIEGSIVGTNEKKYNKSKCDADEVIYRFNDANDDEFWEDYLNKNVDKDNYACYTFKFENGTPVNKYLDVPSEIYVKKLSDGSYTIVGIRAAEEK